MDRRVCEKVILMVLVLAMEFFRIFNDFVSYSKVNRSSRWFMFKNGHDFSISLFPLVFHLHGVCIILLSVQGGLCQGKYPLSAMRRERNPLRHLRNRSLLCDPRLLPRLQTELRMFTGESSAYEVQQVQHWRMQHGLPGTLNLSRLWLDLWEFLSASPALSHSLRHAPRPLLHRLQSPARLQLRLQLRGASGCRGNYIKGPFPNPSHDLRCPRLQRRRSLSGRR